jgi:single-strand DNA-binding protein
MPMNKVIICGYVGQEPELKHLQSGNACVNLSVATPEHWKDKNGRKQEKTEWHRIVVYGKMAEAADQYLSKGQQVLVEGKLQTRSWEGPDGQNRYITEILASNVQFLGHSTKGNNNNNNQAPPQNSYQNKKNNNQYKQQPNANNYAASDIPF